MGLGSGTRAFQEQRIDLPSLVEAEGHGLKAKAVFFPAAANPDVDK